MSKILERLLHKRMIKFLDKHIKVLHEGQYGFRKNRSCSDAIADFIGNTTELIEKGHIVWDCSRQLSRFIVLYNSN